MKVRGIGLVLAAVALFSVMPDADSLAGADSNDGEGKSVWIVRLSEAPVARYEGGVAGVAPTARTAPREGRNDTAEAAYRGYLDRRHSDVAARVGATKIYDYSEVFNGFTADLSASDAQKLRATPGVAAVTKSRMYRKATTASPTFLGLTDRDGLWNRLGGIGAAGEDVVIGVIDTGIWPEHPSFSDQSDLADRSGAAGNRKRVYDAPQGWRGRCVTGEEFDRSDCNNKLIGARYYVDGLRELYGGEVEEEYVSPRDADGHGTHVGATAGGNSGVPASIFGQNLGLISGIAPRARIAAYKALWNPAEGIGADSDIVKAVDDAVRDGVDVLNLSLGTDYGSTMNDPLNLAMLEATAAGVFVAQAAGNAGPDATTNGSTPPWVTTVGAGTQARTYLADVVLGHGAGKFTGESGAGNLPSRPLIAAESAPGADADVEDARVCTAGSLDPVAVRGKVVLCTRGGNYFADKVVEVRRAGGAGAVIANATAGTDALEPLDLQLPESWALPSVHVTYASSQRIHAYITAKGRRATASISPMHATTTAAYRVGYFSSRGPNLASGDVLKPDVVAPGLAILAANSSAPVANYGGQPFAVINGTSMATPHLSGVAALLIQRHPRWSPSMVKSAVMTTGLPNLLDQYGEVAGPFAEGGGFVRPNLADAPGLVYDVTTRQYRAFLCGVDATLCRPGIPALAATELNQPSIAVGNLLGPTTVHRSVTNVGATTATYRSSVSGLTGVRVRVAPSSLTLRPGETRQFAISFDPANATKDDYASGALTWTSGWTVVRSPVVVFPRCADAPGEVDGTGASGSTGFDVRIGCSGSFTARAHGLVPASTVTGTVVDDPNDDVFLAIGAGVGVTTHELVVPAGAEHIRASLSSDQVTDPDDDLDLYLYRSDDDVLESSEQVASSLNLAADEQVDLPAPEAGRYVVVVHGYQPVGASSDYTLSSWIVGSGAAGNFTATAPATVTAGGTASVNATWSGLDANRYLGVLTFGRTQGADEIEIARTLVSVQG